MIKLKQLIETRGFSPNISLVNDLGKWIVVYKKERTLIKGTRPYNTQQEAEQIANLINKHAGFQEVEVQMIGTGNG